MKCARCGASITFNELGLNKKYSMQGGEKYCIACLAELLGVTVKRLEEKIAEFRKAGCKLFTD